MCTTIPPSIPYNGEGFLTSENCWSGDPTAAYDIAYGPAYQPPKEQVPEPQSPVNTAKAA